MVFDAQRFVCLGMHQTGHARQGSSVAPASARLGDCRSNFLAELRIDDSSTAHIHVYAAAALSIAHRTPSPKPLRPPNERKDGAKATGPGHAVGHPPAAAPAPQAACAPPEQARDQPMPGRHVLSTGYVEIRICRGLDAWTCKRRRMNRRENHHEEHGLTRIRQAAGHRRDTACKAARRWSRS